MFLIEIRKNKLQIFQKKIDLLPIFDERWQEWHKNEFQATYAECLKEKAFNEKRAYQFNNNIEVSI